MDKEFYNDDIIDIRFEKDISPPIEKETKEKLHGLARKMDKKASEITRYIYEKHPICKIKDNADGHWLRARSEMLVLRDDKVYILKDESEICDIDHVDYGNPQPLFRYTIPGGGWSEEDEKNERYKTAIRETREEAKLRVKHVCYATNYIIFDKNRTSPVSRSEGKVKEEYRWWGYYTEVYVGEYNGHFHINKYCEIMRKKYGLSFNEIETRIKYAHNKDKKFKKASFYSISDHAIQDTLRPEHKEAIRQYLEYRKEQ